MRLESLLLRLRPRLRYEAVDAGLLLVRRWWLPLTLLCTLPVGLLLIVALMAVDSAIAGLLLMWWLKPLCERLPLWYLSRAVFGEEVPWSRLPGVLRRSVWGHLFATLTLRRFSVSRSYEMPVVVLEGLRGGERRRRTRLLLAGRNAGAASWLTLWLVHVEMVLQFSFFALLYLLLPAPAGMDFQSLANEPRLQLIGYALAMAAVMPFYVGGGFALYLNQRILLEGWDLEVAFRRLAARLANPVQGGGSWRGEPSTPSAISSVTPRRGSGDDGRGLALAVQALALAMLLGLGVLTTPSLLAAGTGTLGRTAETADYQETAGTRIASETAGTGESAETLVIGASTETLETGEAAEILEAAGSSERPWVGDSAAARELALEVLRGSDFVRPETRRVPSFLQEGSARAEAADEGLMATLMQWAQTLAQVVEWLMWTLLAGVGAALLFYAREGFLQRGRRREASRQASVAAPGQSLGPAGEAAGAPSRAQLAACWAAGRQREAMALLFRLAVTRLLGCTGASLAPGTTECELLALAERAAPDLYREPFGRLVNAWLSTAYADRVPDEACFQTLLDEFLGEPVGGAAGGAVQ